ncbi:MAG: hypothetical protein AAB665_04170 [Patescibacteria group bacterium]
MKLESEDNKLTHLLSDSIKYLLEAPISLALIILSSVFIALSIIHGRYFDFGVFTLIYAAASGYWRLFVKDNKLGGSATYHVGNFVLFTAWVIVVLKFVPLT